MDNIDNRVMAAQLYRQTDTTDSHHHNILPGCLGLSRTNILRKKKKKRAQPKMSSTFLQQYIQIFIQDHYHSNVRSWLYVSSSPSVQYSSNISRLRVCWVGWLTARPSFPSHGRSVPPARMPFHHLLPAPSFSLTALHKDTSEYEVPRNILGKHLHK